MGGERCVCLRTLVGRVGFVGHGVLRRARLRGHEAGPEGVEEGDPARATVRGRLRGGRRRGGDGEAGQLAGAARIAPAPGRAGAADAPHHGLGPLPSDRTARAARILRWRAETQGELLRLDGLELESGGLTMTREEGKSRGREWSETRRSEPWSFALCVRCLKLDWFGSGRSSGRVLRVGPACSMRFVLFVLLFSIRNSSKCLYNIYTIFFNLIKFIKKY
jgi:hypothetical protein